MAWLLLCSYLLPIIVLLQGALLFLSSALVILFFMRTKDLLLHDLLLLSLSFSLDYCLQFLLKTKDFSLGLQVALLCEVDRFFRSLDPCS